MARVCDVLEELELELGNANADSGGEGGEGRGTACAGAGAAGAAAPADAAGSALGRVASAASALDVTAAGSVGGGAPAPDAPAGSAGGGAPAADAPAGSAGGRAPAPAPDGEVEVSLQDRVWASFGQMSEEQLAAFAEKYPLVHVTQGVGDLLYVPSGWLSAEQNRGEGDAGDVHLVKVGVFNCGDRTSAAQGILQRMSQRGDAVVAEALRLTQLAAKIAGEQGAESQSQPTRKD